MRILADTHDLLRTCYKHVSRDKLPLLDHFRFRHAKWSKSCSLFLLMLCCEDVRYKSATSRACRACRATSHTVQLATHLPDWSAGGLLRCSAARLSVCRVVLQSRRARHARLVVDIGSSFSVLANENIVK